MIKCRVSAMLDYSPEFVHEFLSIKINQKYMAGIKGICFTNITKSQWNNNGYLKKGSKFDNENNPCTIRKLQKHFYEL